MKVLQVVTALGMGGAETWLIEMLRHWSRTGAGTMDFLITGGAPAVFDDEARRLGATLYYLPYRRAQLGPFVTEFRRLLSAGRYDAIHDHSDYASGWRFLMGLGVLPRVRVTHIHSAWLHIDVNYGVTPVRRFTAQVGKRLVSLLASDICGTSRDVLESYGFIGDSRWRTPAKVVHCGIDVSRFDRSRHEDRASVLHEFGWAEDASLVLFVGRLDRALVFDHPQNLKNSWFALNVVRSASALDPSVRFLVAGSAAEAPADIESRVREWGLGSAIRFLGVRRDIPRLMTAADILLFPSRQEGLGMAAVEAQAAGLPVLASATVPREGVVVPELCDSLALEESLDTWARALLQRIAKPRPSREFCRRALEGSSFSIAESSRRMHTIYARELP